MFFDKQDILIGIKEIKKYVTEDNMQANEYFFIPHSMVIRERIAKQGVTRDREVFLKAMEVLVEEEFFIQEEDAGKIRFRLSIEGYESLVS